jgi:hypothetical protein
MEQGRAHSLGRGRVFGHQRCMHPRIRFSHTRSTRQMPEPLEFRGAFKALDHVGTNYIIDVFQVMQVESEGGSVGVILYRTSDGRAVKRVRNGVFEVEASRITLHRVDSECH